MLSLSHYLLFPSLRRFGETTFKSWQDSQKTTDLYTLCWDDVDKFKKEKFQEHSLTSSQVFPGTLPKEYDDITKSFIFALPRLYIDEIKSQSRIAQTEWSSDYSFDTNIRETCLTPAISHIYVAFSLLADCLYDPITNYFSRLVYKNMAAQMMLYKFWTFQTGRGRVDDHSRLDKLRERLKYMKPGENDEATSEIQKFLKIIKEYEEHLNIVYKLQCVKETCGSNSSSLLILSNPENFTVTASSGQQPSLKISGDVEIEGQLKIVPKQESKEDFVNWVEQEIGGVLKDTKEHDLPVIILPKGKICCLSSNKILFLNKNKWFKSKQDVTYPVINQLDQWSINKAIAATKNHSVVLVRHRDSTNEYAVIKSN